MASLPRFNQDSSAFYSDLKKRVSDYFETQGKTHTGNFSLFQKAMILSALVIGLYIHLVFGQPSGILAVMECLALGAGIAGIGFNVMHDGAHGSFSRSKFLNEMAAFSLNIFGGNSFMWKQKHNVIHHTFTNVTGVDDDIDIQPWLRMSDQQKKYFFHRFQHLYVWFLYAQFFIFWVFYLDYQKYFNRKIGGIPLARMSWRDHTLFWGSKLLHLVIFIILPIAKVGFFKWLLGFLLVSWTTGFVLSLVFQLAHTVDNTLFPVPNHLSGKLEDNWAVHQLKTTSNFAVKNRLVSWFTGGLNYQVEHHLFPRISHVHYPAISEILRNTCKEYALPYQEYPKLRTAILSHALFLRRLGV